MIRSVIFDIDNTLYDYDRANAAAMDAVCSYTLSTFGWSRDETAALMRDSHREISAMSGRKAVTHNRLIRFQRILEHRKLPLSPHALRMYNIYWDALIGSSVLFPGAENALRELRDRGLALGIGTNMTSVIQFRKLEALGILPLFSFIVSSEEAGEEKPGSGIFRMCCGKAGFLPEECLYVGDSLKNDVRGAEAAGLKAAWFRPVTDTAAHTVSAAEASPSSGSAAGEPVSFSCFRELPLLLDRFQ